VGWIDGCATGRAVPRRRSAAQQRGSWLMYISSKRVITGAPMQDACRRPEKCRVHECDAFHSVHCREQHQGPPRLARAGSLCHTPSPARVPHRHKPAT
jgi:hypothetical protein